MSEKENSVCDTAEDIKLTRLAAKAAGYDINHAWNHNRENSDKPCCGLVTYIGEQLQSTYWDPLHDKGNALGLAIKLFIDISMDYDNKTVQASCRIDRDNFRWTEEDLPDDKRQAELAVCRAITRAAAEIGARM